MIYREFGKTGWKISAVGMGAWNIGNQWGDVDEATALATIESALENGINLYDVAESYGIPNGLSEERLGKALSGKRHRVYIVSKMGNWGRRTGQSVPMTSVDMIRLCAHAILYRLRTDWIDVLLCHQGSIEDPSVFLEGFEYLKEQGKVRAYGISTNSLEVLKRFNVNGTCSVLETDYSLLNRKAEKEILPYCQEHDIAVLVRGPLAKGLLSGKYAPGARFEDSVRARWHNDQETQMKLDSDLAVAAKMAEKLKPGEEMVTASLRYVTSHPAGPVVIPGAKSPEQAVMNARAGDKLLSSAECEELVGLLG